MKLLRHIAGFTIGFTIFMLAVPIAIIYVSGIIDTTLSFASFSGSAVRLFFAVPLFAIGVFYALWSNFFLFDRGRGGPADGFGVAVSPRSERLVTTGPYRNTRNPMVFGAFSAYFSIAIYIGSIGGLILLSCFAALVPLYLKKFEETRLVADFGEEYEEYRRRVSMIVPALIKKKQ
ncbi:MAG: isoprenylcysteine carboxylmethyltransferase family protein [Deltaproteobacteria bacterium]|uniref:Isoprenylcysteine carboxylmethyltransferase family protein n=1 Tax=Candidatus Zymogenus saltonus TaxID=2844893 RepID=A0A9D8PQ57_9DELT|nr:isoprenylcysteine carboxylmethyltransferase family protein [Candidatus Zymogenus saltonus]